MNEPIRLEETAADVMVNDRSRVDKLRQRLMAEAAIRVPRIENEDEDDLRDETIVHNDELARLRHNSERWEWCKYNSQIAADILLDVAIGKNNPCDAEAEVDARIAAEKGKQ